MTKLLLACVFFWYGVFIAVGHALPKQNIIKHPPETRIKIAIIDTGTEKTEQIKPFLCKGGHISLVDQEPLSDDTAVNETSLPLPYKHGTNVTGLIVQNLDPEKYCVLIIKFFDPQGEPMANLANIVFAIKYATQMKVSYINLSGGGTKDSDMERRAVEEALKAGIKFTVAAGNDGHNLDQKCDWFPACHDFSSEAMKPYIGNLHVVGSSTYLKGKPKYSNFGAVVKYREDGSVAGTPVNTGTSQAAAIHTNKWIRGEVH